MPGVLLAASSLGLHAQNTAPFDLSGPRIDMRVTRGGKTLPIANVPNLQPGDKVWVHPELPPSQSAHYLLVVAFLRGSTNPPPEDWFLKEETWQKKASNEGIHFTVPADAQQTLLQAGFQVQVNQGIFGNLFGDKVQDMSPQGQAPSGSTITLQCGRGHF